MTSLEKSCCRLQTMHAQRSSQAFGSVPTALEISDPSMRNSDLVSGDRTVPSFPGAKSCHAVSRARCQIWRGAGQIYSKCQKFFPNYPENPLFEKSRFSGPFRQKLLSYSEITLMLFRTLPVAPGCNKVSENEKTSGNRYSRLVRPTGELMKRSRRLISARSRRGKSLHFIKVRIWVPLLGKLSLNLIVLRER